MRRSLITAMALLVGCVARPGVNAHDTHDPSDTDGVATDSDTPGTDTDRPDTDTTPGTRWRLGDEVVCTTPAARATQAYTLLDGGAGWRAQTFDGDSTSVFVGGGVAVADFTGDGLLDLMITSVDDHFALWVQGPGLTFAQASRSLPAPLSRSTGVTAVDADGDGDMDAFVSLFRAPDVLLLNDGHGVFTDGTAAAGLAGAENGRSMSSSWADFDGDGDLDTFVAGYGKLSDPDGGVGPGDPSSLFVNQGDGTFRDLVPAMASPDVLRDAHTFSGAFVDADLDGALDLFLVNDFGWRWPTTMLQNTAGTLVPASDLGVEIDSENMGLGIGDLNGDLVPDFLISAWEDSVLLVSHGGRWFDESRTRGLRYNASRGQVTGWGADLSDLDNDGDLDAIVVFGFIPVSSRHNNPLDQPDGVWTQGDDGKFTDVGVAWGLADPGRHRGVLTVDLNRDGFLDIIRPDLQGPTKIHIAACDAHTWLGVRLHQQGPNRSAIGATVLIHDGDNTWVRDVRAGGASYGSSGPAELHFGLGDRETVDSVQVRWPDGTVETSLNVPTRRFLDVERR